MSEATPITELNVNDISKPEVVKNLAAEIDLSKAMIVDAHLLKTYRACEMKFWWFEEQHVIAKGKAAAPGFGIAMHSGIEWFRRSKIEGRSYNEALKIGAGHLIHSYQESMPAEMKQEVMQDDKRSLNNALRIYQGYCEHYEPFGLRFHYIEIPFALYLGQIKIPHGDGREETKDVVYVGIIDGVLEMHERLYVNDLKTTSWVVSEQWLEGFRMDQGLCGYTVAARELLGVDTQYALVHGIWVQKEPKTKGAKKIDEYFKTKEIYWSDSQLAQWHTNTLRTSYRIEISRQRNDWQEDWGQNCGAFGGCSYRALCSATPEFRTKLIDLDYERAVWTPLEDERLQKMSMEAQNL
ncbi:MAG TPA: PD-(D/E)XK nuclease family protein [Ktedonobacteraceae bacterium]|jgi:hypothetical protein